MKTIALRSLIFPACCALFLISCPLLSRASAAPGFGATDYAECGRNAAEDLQNENKNKYRLAEDVASEQAVEENMRMLFNDKLGPEASLQDLTTHYSPQLHDMKVPLGVRKAIQLYRDAQLLLYGFFQAPYHPNVQDINFRLCCVREQHVTAPTWVIAAYALGLTETNDGDPVETSAYDGWSGIWDYYLPTTITEWSNQSGESMIVPKEKMQENLAEATKMLAGPQAAKMVKTSVGHLLDLAESQSNGQGSTKSNRTARAGGGGGGCDTCGGASGGPNGAGGAGPGGGVGGGIGAPLPNGADQQIEQLVKEIDQKVEQQNKFTEDISMPGGIVVRPNFALMKRDSRQRLAGLLCMHRDQFLKVMDQGDPTQRAPSDGWEGKEYGYLRTIEPFGSIFPNGLKFLMDTNEFNNLAENPAGITDLRKGYEAWQNDMLGREARMANGKGRDWPNQGAGSLPLKEVLRLAGASPLERQDAGWTYMEKNSVSGVSSNMRYHKAPLDRREFNSFALFFREIAALAGGIKGTNRLYMKKFEAEPYHQFGGDFPRSLGKNEFGVNCSNPAYMSGTAITGRKPDRILLSQATHNFVGSPQDESMTTTGMRAQAEDQNLPNRCGRDKERHNYAANMTIHRTCAKGWTLWRPTDPLDPAFYAVQAYCPKTEKLW